MCFLLQERTVSRIVRRHNLLGHVDPSPIPGRPRTTLEQEVNSILDSIRQCGFQSSRKLKTNLNLMCSQRTVRRRLHEQDYHHQIPAQNEKLTINHKEQRLAFAMEHVGWEEEWMRTVFCDEKVFQTDENGRVTLWRTRGTRYAEENIRFRERSGRITLAFWGCMSSHGLGPLVRTTPHMNSEEYIHILAEVMMPYVAESFPGIPYVNFVQDNSGVHRARIVQNWLAQQPNLRTLNWPAKSPDLNVIENVWGIMVQEWNQQIPRTREALAQYVLEKWENLRARLAFFQTLTQSMPQRLNSVIDNNGGVTRY